MLPRGNADEFPQMQEQLTKLGIQFQMMPTKAGGMLFKIPESEVLKLKPGKIADEYLIPVHEDGGFHVCYPEVGDEEKEFC